MKACYSAGAEPEFCEVMMLVLGALRLSRPKTDFGKKKKMKKGKLDGRYQTK